VNKEVVYEAIFGHYERLTTYNMREALVMNKCLNAVSGLFDVLWQHKRDLIMCGAFDQLLQSANILIRVVEERAEIVESRAISSETLTKDIKATLEGL